MEKERSESNCLPHRELVITEKYVKSFWDKVDKKGDDECWNWKAFKNKQGYGKMGVGAGHCVNAHRFSWVIHVGKIPEGLFVCHKCDNTSCVNPKHLFIGTRQDNINDMVLKKRAKHFATQEFYGVRYDERYDGSNRKGRLRSFICKNEKII